jgi:hypothetical protein
MLTQNHAELTLEVAKHLEADALIKGAYWRRGKGCFIGCLTHSDNPKTAVDRFGLPQPLLRIAEDIFEALPEDEGKAFFAALPDAVERDGKDLSRVHWQFLAAELRALPKVNGDVQAVIDPVIEGMDLLSKGQEWQEALAYAVHAAHYAAAYAVHAAHYAAAYAARAAHYAASDAASAASDAASAAAYAARAAHYAASDAASAAHYGAYAASADAARAASAAVRIRQRDTLISLISSAPMGSQ